jgi:hypothetical protein
MLSHQYFFNLSLKKVDLDLDCQSNNSNSMQIQKIRIINFFVSQLHSSFSKPSHFLLTVLKKFGLNKSPLGLEKI